MRREEDPVQFGVQCVQLGTPSINTVSDVFHSSPWVAAPEPPLSRLYTASNDPHRRPPSTMLLPYPLFDPNLLLLNVTLGYRWNALGRTSYALYGQSPSQPQTPPQQILPDAPILVAKETALIIYSILPHGFRAISATQYNGRTVSLE